mmetsp:Transcript_6294/g.13743  ORF Transcript_6294/g.13743 Transcript_6294/m.13743 type:complete len:245 (+) Transcript_6294:23-757(+)
MRLCSSTIRVVGVHAGTRVRRRKCAGATARCRASHSTSCARSTSFTPRLRFGLHRVLTRQMLAARSLLLRRHSRALRDRAPELPSSSTTTATRSHAPPSRPPFPRPTRCSPRLAAPSCAASTSLPPTLRGHLSSRDTRRSYPASTRGCALVEASGKRSAAGTMRWTKPSRSTPAASRGTPSRTPRCSRWLGMATPAPLHACGSGSRMPALPLERATCQPLRGRPSAPRARRWLQQRRQKRPPHA